MKFLNNKEIELPKLTFKVMEKLEYIKENKFKINRLDLIRLKYEFLREYLGAVELNNLLDGDSLEKVDVKNLELLYFSIENEIDRPLNEAHIKEQTEYFNSFFNNKNVKQMLELYNSQNAINKNKHKRK